MTWATLDGSAPRIIAHRGASGLRPEHTLEAYTLALEQGADVVEPDLVVSRDLQLVVRHDRGLLRSTDIATHAAFASRKRDGDWWAEDFDAAEIALLRATQPFPQRDHRHDGEFRIPTFAAALLWAETAARQRNAPVLLYPELKSPGLLAARGRDPLPRFLALARQRNPARVQLWLQCFEIEPLRQLREQAELPVFLLLDQGADWRRALRLHGDAVDGFGAHKSLLADADGRGTGLIDEAHALGRLVHAWTYRDDAIAAGFRSIDEELDLAFSLGVDGVFSDFPSTALRCRQRYASFAQALEDDDATR